MEINAVESLLYKKIKFNLTKTKSDNNSHHLILEHVWQNEIKYK